MPENSEMSAFSYLRWRIILEKFQPAANKNKKET